MEQPRPRQQAEQSQSPRPASVHRATQSTGGQAASAKHASRAASKQLKSTESCQRTASRTKSSNADAEGPDAMADRRPDGQIGSPSTAATGSRPPAEKPAAQVFMCRVSAPCKADAVTQWEARPVEPSPSRLAASPAPTSDASSQHLPARSASAAVEAANRSLAKLERLVKEQHGQARCKHLHDVAPMLQPVAALVC